jgi:hypothetical protein
MCSFSRSIDHLDGRMLARDRQPRLSLNGPERIRLRHRACRLDRLRHDAIDQRIAPDDPLRQPGHEGRVWNMAARKVHDQIPQHLAIPRDQLAGQYRQGHRAAAEARVEKCQQFHWKGARNPIDAVPFDQDISLVSGIAQHNSRLFDENPPDLGPVAGGRERARYRSNAQLPLDRPPLLQPPDDHRKTFGGRQGPDASGTRRITRRLHHSDGSQCLSCLHGLADEEVRMCLEKSACAELQDGRAHDQAVSWMDCSNVSRADFKC